MYNLTNPDHETGGSDVGSKGAVDGVMMRFMSTTNACSTTDKAFCPTSVPLLGKTASQLRCRRESPSLRLLLRWLLGYNSSSIGLSVNSLDFWVSLLHTILCVEDQAGSRGLEFLLPRLRSWLICS